MTSSENSLNVEISFANLSFINSLASINFMWFGPNSTGIIHAAASLILCMPLPNPPPIYAALQYEYKYFSIPILSIIKTFSLILSFSINSEYKILFVLLAIFFEYFFSCGAMM